jgi:hypothetical protein
MNSRRHSTTSSALSRIDGGTSRPKAMLAGLRPLIQTRQGPDWYQVGTHGQKTVGPFSAMCS